MKKLQTHYDNLQVAQTASIEVIRGAYKFLCQKYHPDKHPDNREKAEYVMKLINQAYDVLSEPEKRKQHDAWIAKQQAEAVKINNEKRKAEEEAKIKESESAPWKEMLELGIALQKQGKSRDYILVFLIQKGCPKHVALFIAESVAKSGLNKKINSDESNDSSINKWKSFFESNSTSEASNPSRVEESSSSSSKWYLNNSGKNYGGIIVLVFLTFYHLDWRSDIIHWFSSDGGELKSFITQQTTNELINSKTSVRSKPQVENDETHINSATEIKNYKFSSYVCEKKENGIIIIEYFNLPRQGYKCIDFQSKSPSPDNQGEIPLAIKLAKKQTKNCRIIKSNLDTLKNDQEIVYNDNKGNRTLMKKTERAKALVEAQSTMKLFCLPSITRIEKKNIE